MTLARDGITFNPFLKTKLLGVLGPSFLRQGNNKYADLYRAKKHGLEHHIQYGAHNDGKKDQETERFITSKMRRHTMAIRYMVKMFLIDLYTEWRRLEGLPVSLPYAEAKLGRQHGADAA